MSADKPIKRYDTRYYEMDEQPEGQYVTYSDHLAAIRNARAEAFEEAASHAHKANLLSDGDSDFIVHSLKELSEKERAS